ncbi:5'/3'-nucleotidase SurE [Methylocella silvestris]|uniref:5'-nucleotidase SurE n=1 Tax=Methylocella silvestris TaxID=199596 RepID=A0A2J7TK12_METSI|nr:5'/3'-nucleotidase SurE [Methylocella silvestris]PNG27101.1 5'/3'-nucleotidase SurE [Methylocella silvestris]
MRILVTNDDGVHAPGLRVLEEIAATLSDDVYVVAPESDQSGVAHSLSLNDPLRLRRISERRYAVKGTPTDCVIMGVRRILDGREPDVVLSGVNSGQNVAEDVIYSGTVAGAMEGAILGIPAIALSQAYGRAGREKAFWSCAQTHAPGLIEKILTAGVAPNTVVNINFPDCPPDAVEGVAVTAQGRRGYLVNIDARSDGRGNPYYWIAFDRPYSEPGQGTDVQALAQNRISVTPLRLDITDTPTLTRYAQALG